jgi:hypothetical protein
MDNKLQQTEHKLHIANTHIKILIGNLCVNKRESIKDRCPELNNHYFFPNKEKYIAYCNKRQCIECKNEYLKEFESRLLKLYVVN